MPILRGVKTRRNLIIAGVSTCGLVARRAQCPLREGDMRGKYLLAVLLIFRADAALAMRCGTSLIMEGQSKVEVLQACGEPYYAGARVEYRWAPNWYGPRPLGTPEAYYPSAAVVQVAVDEWVYNFGYTQFMQSLIFENGRLVAIRSLGYGQ